MDRSPFAVLERAELAARECRLTAAAEAEAIVAAARRHAEEIEAALPEEVTEALASLRSEHAQRSDAEIAAAEADLAALGIGEGRPGPDPALDAAIEVIVRAVLGEPDCPASAGPGDWQAV